MHVCPCYTCTHHLTEQFNEAAVAVGFVILLFEGSLVELLQAKRAHKVLRVKLFSHGCDAATGDGLLAARAQRPPPLVVVRLAVRLALVIEEAAINEGRETFPADEAFGMPECVEGRDVVLQDGTGTATTFGGKHVEVILSTERLSILLMKTFRSKKGSTLGAEEVFRMPSLIQSSDNFIQYGSITVVASWGE